jgi:hypothetical protein
MATDLLVLYWFGMYCLEHPARLRVDDGVPHDR